MSLQIWLPLNGDIKNYGTSNAVATNNGSTVNSAGKIGNCYNFNGSSYLTIDVKTSKTMSFCCWFYSDNLSSGNQLIDCRDSSGTGYQPTYITNSIIQIGNSQKGFGQFSYSFAASTWYHVAVTNTEDNTWVYINGNLIGTSSIGGYDFGTLNITIGARCSKNMYFLNGKLNDVRIYDHCLSYDEVKELSKGLVAHYLLSDTSKKENLFSSESYLGNLVSSTNIDRTPDKGITYTSTANSFSMRISNLGFNGEGTYSISFYVKATKSGTLNVDICDVGTATIANIGPAPVFYSGTATVSNYCTPGNYNGFCDFNTSISGGGTVYISYIKVERGSDITSWCPAIVDNTLRTDLIEYDCSGYNRNGIIYSSAATLMVNNSARGKASYQFDGVNNSVKIPFNNMIPSNGDGIFTMNVWIYHTSDWSSKGYETIFGGPGGFEVEAKSGGTNSPLIVAYNWGGGNFSYELNKWNMITMVRTTSDTKFYLNGELKITGSAGSIPAGDYFIGAWRSYSEQNYKGLMSDFRIYATALSADDVAHLYKNFGSVDKNRSLLCSEIKENSENIFKSEYISKYASSLDGSYGQWGTRNSVPCILIQPHKFYYGSGDERNKSVLKDYFIPNTQYIFDMWMDADDVVYNGNNVACGFEIWYTDNTSDSTFVITGNQSNPIGFQHKRLVTAAGKSIKGLGIYYYTSITVYYKVGSFIAPVSQASLGTNGVFNTAQIVEVDGTASINKGGSSYVNSIIEI